jgi:hypothetical protein
MYTLCVIEDDFIEWHKIVIYMRFRRSVLPELNKCQFNSYLTKAYCT